MGTYLATINIIAFFFFFFFINHIHHFTMFFMDSVTVCKSKHQLQKKMQP